MTYQEACEWIALNKPTGWTCTRMIEEFEDDIKRAKEMSDPKTWPENLRGDDNEK